MNVKTLIARIQKTVTKGTKKGFIEGDDILIYNIHKAMEWWIVRRIDFHDFVFKVGESPVESLFHATKMQNFNSFANLLYILF